MKKFGLLLFLCFFSSQLLNSQEVNDLDVARKLALATNKIIVVDFWATWCGPCKKMDQDTWSSEVVKLALNDFIFVKIDIDRNRDLANKYHVKAIPNVFFLDGNGVPIENFLGDVDSDTMKSRLDKYAISTSFISNELMNYNKSPNYSYGVRLLYKYYDFLLLAENDLKINLLHVCDFYLSETNDFIEKNDENYIQKKQKIELLKLYDLAYRFKFEKLGKKILEFELKDIAEYNLYDYYFLKLLSTKALNGDVSQLEAEIINNNLEIIIDKVDKISKNYGNKAEK